MTATPDQQYHRAPLNGLLIGTIVGTVCAAVFLLASEGTEFNLAILAVALGLVLSFSLLGWIDGSSQSSVEGGSETAGVEYCPSDVVGQVTEPESGPAEVLEPSVDRFGRAVAGAGMIEERQDVAAALVERPAKSCQLGQSLGDPVGQRLDDAGERGLPGCGVLAPVSRDQLLIDAPCHLDADVIIAGEQVLESLDLSWSEQIQAGME